MTIATGLTLLALGLAVAAHLRAQALTRRLDVLTELYWELKYDHGALKAQVTPPPPRRRSRRRLCRSPPSRSQAHDGQKDFGVA